MDAKKFWYTKEQIQQLVDSIPLIVYAEQFGLTFKNDGRNTMRCNEHSSLLIDVRKNRFYWNSMGVQGNIITFIMEFEHKSYLEALNMLEKKQGFNFQPSNEVKLKLKEVRNDYSKQMEVPPRLPYTQNIIGYLCDRRNLDIVLVAQLIQKGRIFQDDKGNCCFVGVDEKNQMQYIMRRGMAKGSSFKNDVYGSIKEVGFYVENDSKFEKVIVSESIIDALSYQSISNLNGEIIDYNLLGSAGAEAMWITFNFNYVKRGWKHSLKEVVIAADNDQGGNKNYEAFVKECNAKYPHLVITREIPTEKDFNDDLIKMVQKEDLNLSTINTNEINMEDNIDVH